jgi:hypothetical protein
MDKTKAIFKIIRVFGYGNLVALSYLILTLKRPLESWVPIVISVTIAFVGTVIYYAFWGRLFSAIPKPEGRKIMRPYILGAVITVSSILLVTLILLYAKLTQGQLQ